MASKKTRSNKKSTKATGGNAARRLSPKTQAALKKAADALWSVDDAPHTLLKELHDVLLLRCLDKADGNYAAAAAHFGPTVGAAVREQPPARRSMASLPAGRSQARLTQSGPQRSTSHKDSAGMYVMKASATSKTRMNGRLAR